MSGDCPYAALSLAKLRKEKEKMSKDELYFEIICIFAASIG